MNIDALNGGLQTFGHYVVATIILTLLTTWVIIAFQYPFRNRSMKKRQSKTTSSESAETISTSTFRPTWFEALQRAAWPIIMVVDLWEKFNSQRGASKDVKGAPSPRRTRPRRKWPRIHHRPKNIRTDDGATDSSGFTESTKTKAGVWWAPRLSRTGGSQEENTQQVFVQSPVPLSTIREDTREEHEVV